MNSHEAEAFERLLVVAERDTGQSKRVADFILAWWNSASWGGFDPISLSNVDQSLADDMLTILTMLVKGQTQYPTEYRSRIEGLIREWRQEDATRP